MDQGAPDDGLTDELAASIGAELEAEESGGDEPRVEARLARDGGGVELVLVGAGEEDDVVTALTPEEARALAARLEGLAGA